MRTAFTIVELLVVVSIIVVLLALLSPALDRAVEAGVRANCASQQHALLQIFSSYASGRSNRRYPGGRSDAAVESAFEISTPFVDLVVSYAGNNKTVARGTSLGGNGTTTQWGVVPRILIDPSYKDFGWHGANGWGTGYNYLGGRPWTSKANAPWQSPMSLSNAGSGQLLSCLNNFDTGRSYAWVAHAREGGPLGEDTNVTAYWAVRAQPDPRGSNLKSEGDDLSAGGNIARTDGSVLWTPLNEMESYFSIANSAGGAGAGWYALW